MVFPHLNRRRFLQAASTAAACGLVSSSNAAAVDNESLIDTHVYVGHWPLRRLPAESPAELVALLRRGNVTQAWAGSFDGLFHKDVQSVNSRLAKMCREEGGGLLLPIGTVNPTLPDWEEDVRRCHESFKMPGIRLHPAYHGYALDDPRFARLLALAAERGLFVQLVARLTNERRRFLTPRVTQVDLGPLAQIVSPVRELRLLIVGTKAAEMLRMKEVLNRSSPYFDFARATDVESLGRLVKGVSVERIVYGSASPLMDVRPGSNVLQQAKLTAEEVHAISSGNAPRLIP
jgi:predicted TIM-barrel fold metal-dependent hydrolase